jgi:hypothetical protein
VVLKEKACPSVENQQLRKNRLATTFSLMAQRFIIVPSGEFSLNLCACEKNNVALKLCKEAKSVEA